MAFAADYIDVAARIAEFRAKYPEGTLQASVIAWPTQDAPFVAVRALAFRNQEDDAPGVGLAWEPVPGKTNFTRDSELQNAETSAWGRAIVAVGAADTKKGIASADEVRNRTSAGGAKGSSPAVPQSEGVGKPVETIAFGEGASAPKASPTPSDSSCVHPKRVTTAAGGARCAVCGAKLETA